MAATNLLIFFNFYQIDNTVLINGQKTHLHIHQDSEGSRIIIDGDGHALILSSLDFIRKSRIKTPIKSISIINAPGSLIEYSENQIELVDSENSTIRHNNIKDITNSSYAFGILLDNCPNTEIYNNTIYNITSTSNSTSAIYLVNSQNTTITNNTIEMITSTSSVIGYPRDTYGIQISNSKDATISDVKISRLESLYGNGYGISIESSQGSKINDSDIDEMNSKSSHGIRVFNSSNSVIEENTITNIFSSTLASFGISVDESPNSEIFLNNIDTIDASQNEGYGVYLGSCTNANVSYNTIQSISSFSFTYGVSLKASMSAVIEWNDISDLVSSFEAIGIFTKDCISLAVQNNTIANISPSFGLYFIKCNDTTISDNVFSSVSEWIYIDETSYQVQYSENTVDGSTIKLQSFIRPTDLIIEEGNKSNSISWIATDTQVFTYTIFEDGVFKDTGTWTSGSPIIHNLNYSLSIGNHSYQLVLTETTGNQITDDVIVSVVEIDLPQIVHSPDDLYLSIGASDQVLSWTLTDSYPLNYFLYFNGTEVVFDTWNSSEPINYTISVLDIDEYTVFNYTLVATDSSGNTIIDTVLVFVFDVEIKTEMPPQMQFEYKVSGRILNLNWTVYSNESGAYTIYQENGTVRTVIDSGVYIPGDPILYQIDIGDLSVGTYKFIIVINQDVEDHVTVIVYANPDIPEAQEETNRTPPHQPIPPYLAQPAANPWPTLILGGFIVLVTGGAMYWVVTRHLMVPSAVKDEKRALKKARKVKDIHEEGKRLGAIGRIYFKAGNFKKAIDSHKAALAAFKKAGDKKLQIRELESLGDTYSALGVDEI